MYPRNPDFFIRNLFWGKGCVGCRIKDPYVKYIQPFVERGKPKTVDTACSSCKKAYFKYHNIFEALNKLHHVTSQHTFMKYELLKIKNKDANYAKTSIRVFLWENVVVSDPYKKEGFVFSIPFSEFFSIKMVAYIKYKWVIYTNRMSMIMQHFKRQPKMTRANLLFLKPNERGNLRCFSCGERLGHIKYISHFVKNNKLLKLENFCSSCLMNNFKYFHYYGVLPKLYHTVLRANVFEVLSKRLSQEQRTYCKMAQRVLLWNDSSYHAFNNYKHIPKKTIYYMKFKFAIYTNRLSMILYDFQHVSPANSFL